MDLISAWSFKSEAEQTFLEWSLSRFPESLEEQYLEAGANKSLQPWLLGQLWAPVCEQCPEMLSGFGR